MDTANLDSLTIYDMVVIGIFLILIIRGLWTGALRQVTGFVALYGAYFVASQYHQVIAPMLGGISESPRVIFLISCAILFVATYVAVLIVGWLLHKVVQLALAGWFDRLLGGILGVLEAMMIVIVIHLILSAVLSPENQMVKNCLTCKVLNPAADFARELIRDPEARKSLLQKTPAVTEVKERLDSAFRKEQEKEEPKAKEKP